MWFGCQYIVMVEGISQEVVGGSPSHPSILASVTKQCNLLLACGHFCCKSGKACSRDCLPSVHCNVALLVHITCTGVLISNDASNTGCENEW